MSFFGGGTTTTNSTSSGNVVTGDFYVTGDTFLEGDATIGGNAIVDGSLTVEGAASFEDDVTIMGDTSVTGALGVTGTITATGSVTALGGLYDSHGLLGQTLTNSYVSSTPTTFTVTTNPDTSIHTLSTIVLPKGTWKVEAVIPSCFLGDSNGNSGVLYAWIGNNNTSVQAGNVFLLQKAEGEPDYTNLPMSIYCYTTMVLSATTTAYLNVQANVSEGFYQWVIYQNTTPMAMTATLLN